MLEKEQMKRMYSISNQGILSLDHALVPVQPKCCIYCIVNDFKGPQGDYLLLDWRRDVVVVFLDPVLSACSRLF